jgi:hypothetical protein
VELSFIKESKINDMQFRKFELVASISEETDARALFFETEPVQPLPIPEQLSGLESGFVSMFSSEQEESR